MKNPAASVIIIHIRLMLFFMYTRCVIIKKKKVQKRYAMDLRTGDIVRMKKNHPCGSNTWEILRTGADIRLKCTGCGHQMMLPRTKTEKSIKEIIRQGPESEGIEK